jgi:hypothetical protein
LPSSPNVAEEFAERAENVASCALPFASFHISADRI